MPSYHRFIVCINRLSQILQKLLDKYCENLNQELGMIDSTKIKTTSNYWIGKVFKEANKGYSSTGEFRGFKLHVLIKHNKSLCNYKITPANVHDITPIKEGFLNNQQGIILADSGYISKNLYYELMQSNTLLIAKPKK